MKISTHKHDDIYDFIIWGVGYESRSIHLAGRCKHKASIEWVFGYKKNNDVCCYQKNLDFFSQRGSDIHEVDDYKFNEIINSSNFSESVMSSKNILIDITVLTRKRIASLVIYLIKHMTSGSLLTLSYSPSKYVPAPLECPPISVIGPLHDELNGEIGDLSKPSALILGVGYEPGKASGIFSYLDCELNYLLFPKSSVSEFEIKLKSNNRYIIECTPKNNIYYYNLESPLLTYSLLNDIVYSCTEDYRPVIVPLGPKILTALSVVIGLNYKNVPIWRVSSDHEEEPVDRVASGKIMSFSLVKDGAL